MSFDKLSDPVVLVLLSLVLALALVLFLRKKPSEIHVQQASHGGTIHHDARTTITVILERRA